MLIAIALLALPEGASALHSQYESVPAAATLFGLSNDGSRMIFSSFAQLSSEDTDFQSDLYVRVAPDSTPILLSTGPAGGAGPYPAYFAIMSEDAQRVFFLTQEQLVSEDTDARYDLYERFGGTTSLVSTGAAGGNGPYDPFDTFFRASADGTHVFFETQESLVTEDQDTRPDLYERSGGITGLVTTGPDGGNGAFDGNCEFFQDRYFSGYACRGSVSRDGSTVVFPTKEALVAADKNATYDFYKRSGGTTTLVSTGPNGGNEPCSTCGIPYREPLLSADGSRIFFESDAPLVSSDTDSGPGCDDGLGHPGCRDVYERSGGTTTLISTGPAGGNGAYDVDMNAASENGDRVLFSTYEPLVADDTNGEYDLYERRGGTTTEISKGPTGSGRGFFEKASSDGAHVLFTSNVRLTSADTDSSNDLYEWFNGTLTALSIGPSGGNNDAYHCCLNVMMSRNGEWVFFRTIEPLLSEDNDDCGGPCPDIYESYRGGLSIVTPDSVGSPSGGYVVPLVSDDGATIAYQTNSPYSPTIYRARLDTTPGNGYARPRGATPTIIRLVPAFAACSSANATHGPPFAAPSCSPPRQASDYLTIGTADSNGQPANFTGYLKLKVVGESPINLANGDQADVQITSQMHDIRRKSDLGDYAGNISFVLGLRITDRNNGAGLNQGATVSDTPLTIPATYCSPTSGSSGSMCETLTTLDAVMPGLVVEAKRGVWQIGQVRVYDSGADGDGDTTGDNTLFLTQGLFAP
jgi:hypothetical protein